MVPSPSPKPTKSRRCVQCKAREMKYNLLLNIIVAQSHLKSLSLSTAYSRSSRHTHSTLYCTTNKDTTSIQTIPLNINFKQILLHFRFAYPFVCVVLNILNKTTKQKFCFSPTFVRYCSSSTLIEIYFTQTQSITFNLFYFIGYAGLSPGTDGNHFFH